MSNGNVIELAENKLTQEYLKTEPLNIQSINLNNYISSQKLKTQLYFLLQSNIKMGKIQLTTTLT